MKLRTWVILIILLLIIGYKYYPRQTQNTVNLAGDIVSDVKDLDLKELDYESEMINSPKTNVSFETVKIGNWNLQIFGKTKAGKEELMEVYVEKIQDYDIFFVQEIRDKSGTAFSLLCESLEGYSCVNSTRSGRSGSKEQYGIVYKSGLELVELYDYAPDYQGEFERPPVRVTFDIDRYEIVIFNIHVKPNDVVNELTVLEELSSEIDGNVVILGDLNADCVYYDHEEEEHFEDWEWVIEDEEDTTVSKTDCAYDRIILNEDALEEFVVYGIDDKVIEEESDHYLVWFEQKLEE